MATIEQLINCSAAELEAMSDAELLKHFEPMFNITRPEMAAKKVIKQEQQLAKVNPKLAQGLDLLKGLGVNVQGALAPYKKGKR